jgi:Ca2+-binding RTX toxin-like protein
MEIRCQGWLAVTIAALSLGAFAPAAGAATAQITDDGTEQVLHYTAAPGEVNSLTLAAPDATDANYSFVDTGAGVTITAGTGCTAMLTGNGVDCDPTGVDRVEIALDDGNDHLHMFSSNVPVHADTGAGDDSVEDPEIGPATSTRSYEGGEGADYFAGKGDGLLPNDYKGGPGRDTVSYEYRLTPVSVSIDDVANDGAPAEGDNVHSDVEVVYGSAANDTLVGSGANDTLVGLDGADDIQGLGGDDQLEAWGRGAVDATAMCDIDVLDGGPGADRLFLGGRTTAHGGPDGDQLMGDSIVCAAGGDDVHGDEGTDGADFSIVTGPLSISLDDQANDGIGGKDNFHADIEDLYGGPGGMTLIGSDGPNNIVGGPGNDVLDGRGGKDQLSGREGIDLADYSTHTAPVTLTLDSNEADNDGAAGEGDAIWTDIENLRGGQGDDTLAGGAADNVLDGGPGADMISGGGGVDAVDYSNRTAPVNVTLAGGASDDGEAGEHDNVAEDVEGAFGGSGNDTLVGNAAAGFLSGFAGNDSLSDPGGADTLDAGVGDDTINSVDGFADTDICGAGTDSATSDTIDTVGADCEPPPGPDPDPDPDPTPGPDPTPTPGPGPGPGPSNPAPKPIDHTAPTATTTYGKSLRLRGLRSKGLKVSVLSNESGTIGATLTAESSTRRWLKRHGVSVTTVLASGKAKATAGARKTVTLRLTRKGRKGLKALTSGRFKLVVVVTDGVGNRRTVTSHLRMGG